MKTYINITTNYSYDIYIHMKLSGFSTMIFASSEMKMNYIYTNENTSLINEKNNTTVELLLSKINDPYNCKIRQIIILI